jgi:phosphopantothenoylcysteine synthetase/decarboxylase
MKALVTAGNTQTPIDRVRCLTNIFTGRTGALIALEAHQRGHAVTLLTSHPDVVSTLAGSQPPDGPNWAVERYQTFDDLHRLFGEAVRHGGFDAVIHCAAVSDYAVAGVYVPAAGTAFNAARGRWQASAGEPALEAMRAGKVKSHHPELWLRLTPTPKLVDQVRRPWGFAGVLVKFKLEVDMTEPELLAAAERSRRESDADLMVANTLDDRDAWAYLGPLDGRYAKVNRPELAARLVAAVEARHRQRRGG